MSGVATIVLYEMSTGFSTYAALFFWKGEGRNRKPWSLQMYASGMRILAALVFQYRGNFLHVVQIYSGGFS